MKKEKTTLIKPKKNKVNGIENKELIVSIILLIIGIILLTNSSQAVIIVCYCLGIISIIIGTYNLINYYQVKKELNIENTNNLVIGVMALFIGFLIIILASAIETFLRFIIGIILIFNGIKKIILGIDFKNYLELTEGIILVLGGLYTIIAENIVFIVIGLLLVISSVIDIITYLKGQNK
jgi:uncharacterized membrane protein HdeD (DUF308 family)